MADFWEQVSPQYFTDSESVKESECSCDLIQHNSTKNLKIYLSDVMMDALDLIGRDSGRDEVAGIGRDRCSVESDAMKILSFSCQMHAQTYVDICYSNVILRGHRAFLKHILPTMVSSPRLFSISRAVYKSVHSKGCTFSFRRVWN